MTEVQMIIGPVIGGLIGIVGALSGALVGALLQKRLRERGAVYCELEKADHVRLDTRSKDQSLENPTRKQLAVYEYCGDGVLSTEAFSRQGARLREVTAIDLTLTVNFFSQKEVNTGINLFVAFRVTKAIQTPASQRLPKKAVRGHELVLFPRVTLVEGEEERVVRRTINLPSREWVTVQLQASMQPVLASEEIMVADFESLERVGYHPTGEIFRKEIGKLSTVEEHPHQS